MVKSWFTPLLIFVLALVIRCYLLPSTAIYSADEEYQSTYARTITLDFHPVWIGVSAADTGFYLGPYFTYFTSLWQYLGHNDPLVTNYVASIIGALTAVLIYLIGRQIGGTNTGVIASLIYSFSPLVVYLDQRYWNPSPAGFVTCLLLYALINLKAQKWWLVVITFCLGSFWHIHLALVPLTFVAIYVVWQWRTQITPTTWFMSVMMLGVMFAPLMIFDYNHDYSNILTPVRMIQLGGRSLSLADNTRLLGETLARSLYLSPGTVPSDEIRPGCPTGRYTTASILMVVLALLPLIIFYARKGTWQKRETRYLALASLLMTLSFMFYPGEVTGYYALGLFPLYFLIIATLLSGLRLRYFLILLFAIISLSTLLSTFSDYGLSAKRDLIGGVMSYLGDSTFSLQEEGTCHKYGGWRYLFLSYGRPPTTSSADASLSWLYPTEVGSPGEYLVIVTPTGEFIPQGSPLTSIMSRGYTAYILQK
jgi:4-amino-4-deoxy-L-arabinose transferase-like glycosyltransferase